jgi:hypothetical protein
MVVYRGELGLEQDAVVAQYKDLCEPHHLLFWNATDYCCVNGALYTPSEITATPELSRQLDTNGNGKPDIYYFASPVNIYITFSGTIPTPEPSETTYTVAFHDLPPGNYGEVVVLQDQDNYYCSTLWNVIDSSPEDFPGFDFYWYLPDEAFPGHRTYFAYQIDHETDQIGNEYFNYQPRWHRLVPITFRGIPIQYGIRFAFTHPDEIACEDSDWPDAPDAQAYPPVINR